MLYVLYSIHAEKGNEILMIQGSGFNGFRLRRILDDVFPYRQPSPRGEGAPKGRIGHRRYERAREGASQAGDL